MPPGVLLLDHQASAVKHGWLRGLTGHMPLLCTTVVLWSQGKGPSYMLLCVPDLQTHTSCSTPPLTSRVSSPGLLTVSAVLSRAGEGPGPRATHNLLTRGLGRNQVPISKYAQSALLQQPRGPGFVLRMFSISELSSNFITAASSGWREAIQAT